MIRVLSFPRVLLAAAQPAHALPPVWPEDAAIADSFTRKIILGLCSNSDGYLLGRDDAIRARSNADLARFLDGVLGTARR